MEVDNSVEAPSRWRAFRTLLQAHLDGTEEDFRTELVDKQRVSISSATVRAPCATSQGPIVCRVELTMNAANRPEPSFSRAQ